jgi:glucokinase
MSSSLSKIDAMHAHPYPDGPRLLADIGGTNARFALEYASGKIINAKTLACADFASLTLAMQAYLNRWSCGGIRHAIVAIANPVTGDLVKMTNHHWEFSIEATRSELKFDTLLVVNDFAALAMAVPMLGDDEFEPIGGGTAVPEGVIGVMGAGTGLGVSGLMFAGNRWLAIESEGGHAAFSPSDERELAVLQYCWQRYDHVSVERLVSGPGIALIYEALAAQQTPHPAALSTAAIVARAMSRADPLCQETIACFCGMLGTVAANLAVTLCTKGGIYIGGGIVPRLGGYFATSPFRSRFESKGRFSSFNAQIPTSVITAPFPAFQGAAAILADYLDTKTSNPFAVRRSVQESRTGASLQR